MEISLLFAAIIMVSCVSIGLSGVYIARSRTSINKHSRQRIKDFESDIKYLTETKKEEIKDYRAEVLRLKGQLNKVKQGTTITDNDMKNSGLGEVIMQLVPRKYQKAASFLIPQVEEAVKKDPALIEKVYEKIKSANTTNNKTSQSESGFADLQTL